MRASNAREARSRQYKAFAARAGGPITTATNRVPSSRTMEVRELAPCFELCSGDQKLPSPAGSHGPRKADR